MSSEAKLRWIAAALIVAGVLAFGFGLIHWVSIPSSDTQTSTLVWAGIGFAVPGLIAIFAGLWLLRSAPRGSEST